MTSRSESAARSPRFGQVEVRLGTPGTGRMAGSAGPGQNPTRRGPDSAREIEGLGSD
jgi:hypothetical protein